MRKRVRSKKSKPVLQAVSPACQQRVLQIAQVLVGAQDALHEMIVDVGQQVLAAMLEQDREALCGAKGRRDPDRDAYRYGRNRGPIRCQVTDLTLPAFRFPKDLRPSIGRSSAVSERSQARRYRL